MGLTYADIEVENLFTHRALKTKSRVDSGTVFLTIPEHIAVQLGYDLTEVGTREVVLADGSRKTVPMAGPLRRPLLRPVGAGDGRRTAVRHSADGNDGSAAPLPASQKLIVNPESPFVPVALAK